MQAPSTESEYRWPAEWEPHAGTLLSWPQRPELWSGRIDAVRSVYVEIIRALSEGELVRVLVNNEASAAELRAHFANHGIACGPNDAVEIWTIPTNDVWIRDYGPLRLRREQDLRHEGERHSVQIANDRLPDTPDDTKLEAASRMIAYSFTGWGGKFAAEADDRAAQAVAARMQEAFYKHSDFVLEGGAIETNGRGLLITTEACLLHPNRNPDLNRQQIEARLKATLGAHSVLWLPNGLPGDDTDGHVDMITRFVGEDRVLSCLPDSVDHPAYSEMEMNLTHLRDYRGPNGKKLHVETLPLPRLRRHSDGTPVPESYANFYIGNHVVLVPVFDDPERDPRALNAIQSAFPDRRVIGLPGSDLILEGGGIHCMTMQIAR